MYWPAEQFKQALMPLAPAETPNVPTGHCVHCDNDVAPGTELNEPTGQSVQEAAPESVANEPGAQGVHDVLPEDELKVPGEHDVHAEEPAVEYWPAGQARQFAKEKEPPSSANTGSLSVMGISF